MNVQKLQTESNMHNILYWYQNEIGWLLLKFIFFSHHACNNIQFNNIDTRMQYICIQLTMQNC